MHAASHSSVWRADRPSDRCRRTSSVRTAESRAPEPPRPRRPEPDRMRRARRCTWNNSETTLAFPTAVSHAGKRIVSVVPVYEDGLHAEGTGYSAGVLATCAAKTGQNVLRGIVTFSLRRCREVLYPIQHHNPSLHLTLNDT